MSNQIVHEGELGGYTVVGKVLNEAVMTFDVYEVAGEIDRPLYLTKDRDFTADLSKASRFLTGDVKWDGCSNWTWDPDEQNVMTHFCENPADGLKDLFDTIYAMAFKELADCR